MRKIKNPGFTLIEILLAVAALVILAGIVIMAINPTKQLSDTRNAKRQMDVTTILNAVYQWAIDNGSIPASIQTAATTTSSTEICRSGVTCTATTTDLSVLTNLEKYLVSIPADLSSTSTIGTGYHIYRSSTGRIKVVAPLTENGKATISVTR
jgi:prepilin-type N-terminal cleavage/methylation domain-containing protein